MQIRFNIPVLQEEEIWKRNEQIKHWGSYIPINFKKGKPTYILPNHLFIFTQFFYHCLLLAFLVYDFINSQKHTLIVLTIRLILFLTNIFLVFILVKIDPGICSRSDPIINEHELSRYKNFCTECKCMQSEAISHCIYCDVCIQGRYAHANITNMCITKKNCPYFVILCLTTVVQTLMIV